MLLLGFFEYIFDYALKFLALWQPVLYVCFLIFRKPIVRLIDRIKKLKIKDFEVVLTNPEVSEKVKLALISYLKKLIAENSQEKKTDFKGFMCHGTCKKNNITGDGSLYQLSFEKCDSGDENIHNGIYVIDQSGVLLLSWYLLFEGIVDQEEAIVKIDSSNESIDFRYPNIQSLKNSKGHLVLRGETAVEMDAGDTLKLSIQIGSDKNSKLVSLSASTSSFFNGSFM